VRTYSVAAVVLAAVLTVGAAGCAGSSATERQNPVTDATERTVFRILPDPAFGAQNVVPRRPASITVTSGSLKSVELTDAAGNRVDGSLSSDKRSWTADGKPAFATQYQWQGVAVDKNGKRYPISGSFQTIDPDVLVTTTTNVVDGGIYPADLRIAVTFSAPVQKRDMVANLMQITTSPRTRGSWQWSEDGRVATWQPRGSWRPGTKVELDAELYGVMLAPGHYGAADKKLGFRITDQ